MKTVFCGVLIFIISVRSGFGQPPENPTNKSVRQIFPAKRLDKKYRFHFEGNYEEHVIRAGDGVLLSAVLFHAENSARGVILYLHGNTGGMETWGKLAPFYTSLGYDFFVVDYRGYGKSGGTIKNESQLFSDLQTVYDTLKSCYPENKITVMGYSIGTGPAAMLAANNNPKQLILDAPYYSLIDAVQQLYPKATLSDLPFRLDTYTYLAKTACPIVIFHGDSDKEFYYGGSLKLKTLFKQGDTLITLKGQDHGDFEKNSDYIRSLHYLLVNH
jgi:dienelactone hydrolase